MPDIDPAALSRTSTGLTMATTPITATKTLPTPVSTQKTPKAATMGQRIDLEPIYKELKAAIGEHWLAYKEATSLFVLGYLNQSELSARIDHFICVDINRAHLHNQLIAAIYGNVTRDLPDQGVANWVSTNDKPSPPSKPISGDATEQRLKMEIMQLSARDRRRLKDIPENDAPDLYATLLGQDYFAKQIKPPDIGPLSAGGMNKTNWDMEIRKRYAQPLASETGEFPDAESIAARMTPICYEHGIVNGAADGVAAFAALATDAFMKEVLSEILDRTRSNGPNYVSTASYKKQLRHEEAAFARGEIQRNNMGLLPVEQHAANQRTPLTMNDLRLNLDLGSAYLAHMPLTNYMIRGDYLDGELRVEGEQHQQQKKPHHHHHTSSNGIAGSTKQNTLDLSITSNGTTTATATMMTTTTTTTSTVPSLIDSGDDDHSMDGDGDGDGDGYHDGYDASSEYYHQEGDIYDEYHVMDLDLEMDDDGEEDGNGGIGGKVDENGGIGIGGMGVGGGGSKVDENEDFGWEGGSARDRKALNRLLDECLAIGT
ncbi:MAG: hypothetical protein M1823_004933 [Watsoniomyces obsoletus]|nr:MAG: hypothetical protein M1823_004933 [Watsoniomyces obsoletus]